MKLIERTVEATILGSRWLLVVFYLGLTVALGVYAVSFGRKLLEYVGKIAIIDDSDSILKILGLIDAALVASLIVMVIISGYENFVSRFDNAQGKLTWLGKIDAGSLKVKVASTIVLISSIHLLQYFSTRHSMAITSSCGLPSCIWLLSFRRYSWLIQTALWCWPNRANRASPRLKRDVRSA